MESARSMVKERSWLPLTLVRASSRTLLRVSSSCILCMGTYAQHPVASGIHGSMAATVHLESGWQPGSDRISCGLYRYLWASDREQI